MHLSKFSTLETRKIQSKIVQSITKRFGVETIAKCWKYKYRIVNHDKTPIPDYLRALLTFRDSVRDLRKTRRIEVNVKSAMGDSILARRLRLLDNSLPSDLWKCEFLNIYKTRVMAFL
ncbi:hypothetical protein BV898_10385 [Hypsibius exemplaris]|uniref:Uncharacterized protein n=1 Tax=Hypsibius exemplaris TaxID=2072580 RepID=A0A1W0WJX4_HYPEX|nr:hypothetical protein BV898_10385 [Hypsibius exemplaris]